jgi:hypothetical protein
LGRAETAESYHFHGASGARLGANHLIGQNRLLASLLLQHQPKSG